MGQERPDEDFSEFVDRRSPENEAQRQAVHAAGLDRRKKYIGPERRKPENAKLRQAIDARISDFAERGETPVVDSHGKNAYAESAMKTCRRTGDKYPALGDPDGILID